MKWTYLRFCRAKGLDEMGLDKMGIKPWETGWQQFWKMPNPNSMTTSPTHHNLLCKPHNYSLADDRLNEILCTELELKYLMTLDIAKLNKASGPDNTSARMLREYLPISDQDFKSIRYDQNISFTVSVMGRYAPQFLLTSSWRYRRYNS